jgi:hypothetical protein
MNIYNFIFACFYNKVGYPELGRLARSTHVLFALFSHVLLIIDVVYCVTGYKNHLFSESIIESLFHRKQVCFIYCIPFFIYSWLFYDEKRTKKILEKFNDKDEYIMQGDSNRAGLYFLGPFLVTMVLICLKQYNSDYYFTESIKIF